MDNELTHILQTEFYRLAIETSLNSNQTKLKEKFKKVHEDYNDRSLLNNYKSTSDKTAFDLFIEDSFQKYLNFCQENKETIKYEPELIFNFNIQAINRLYPIFNMNAQEAYEWGYGTDEDKRKIQQKSIQKESLWDKDTKNIDIRLKQFMTNLNY